MIVGYKRVSSVEQKFDRQDLGDIEKVFEEKVSGANTEREALAEMIEFVREGDEVVVYSIDRLARNLRDLQTIIQQLNDNGVTVRFLSERLVFTTDTNDAFAKLQLQLMGAFAEFERELIRERTIEGLIRAKSQNKKLGRPKGSKDSKPRPKGGYYLRELNKRKLRKQKDEK